MNCDPGACLIFELEPGVRETRIAIPSNSPDSPGRVDLIGTNDVVFFDGFEQD